MRQARFLAVILLVTLLTPSFYPLTVLADFNQEINYQGKLTDDAGTVVADGDYGFYFRLYTVATGGSEIWEEDRDTDSADHVAVTDGLFSVMLGDVESLAGIDFNQTLYLGVEVCGSGGGSCDGEMTPRKVLGAVPAAFEAQKLSGLATSSFLRSDAVNSTTTSSTFFTLNQAGTGAIVDFQDGGSSVFTILDGGGSIFSNSLTVGATSSAVTLGTGEILATALKFNASSTVYADEENLIFADATVGAKTLSELLVGALTCAQSDAVISGGVVTYSGSGFIFDVSPTTYCINGLQYSVGASQVTLDDADLALDRIDAIVVNTSSAVDSVTGMPGQNPSAPSIDPDTQLSLTIVFVGAGSTQPGPDGDGPVQEIIYLENSEWTGSQTTPTGEVSFSDNTDPQQGTTHVEVTTPLAAGDFFQFASSTATWNPTGFATLSFYIKVKTAFVANNNRLVLTFRNNAGAQVGTAVTVQHNTFGFDRTNTSAYQKIAIPLSNFGSVGTAIKYLRFTTQGSNPINFRIDNIVAEGTTQGTATNFTLGSVIFAGTSGVLSEDHDYFFWDATNNRLGIGTTSPYAALSVAGQIVGANFTSTTTTSTSTFAGILSVGSTTPVSNPLFVVGNSIPALFVSKSSSKVGIHTNNVENLTMSGSSGFGAALTVRNGAVGFSSLFNLRLESYGAPGYVVPTRANGTQAAPTVVSAGDNVLALFPLAYDGTDYEPMGGISIDVDNSDGVGPGDDDMPGRIVFSTTPDGDFTAVERMRIDNQGRVGINTQNTTLDFTTMLTVNGNTSDDQAFAFKARANDDTDLFTVRNDGAVSISSLSDGCVTVSSTILDSQDCGGQWTISGSDIYYDIGNVGIGTSSPGSALSIAGSIFASSTGATSTFQGTGINLISAAGHVPCFAINGSCLTGTVSGGFAGMMASWATSNSLVATSGPTASHFVATSSTATSTFVDKLTVGTSTANINPLTALTMQGGIVALETGLDVLGINNQPYGGSLFTGYRQHGGQVLGVGKSSRINWTIGTSYGDCTAGSSPTCSSFMIALSTTTDADYVATSSLLQESALISMDQNGRVGISTGTPAARFGVYVPGPGTSFLRLSSSTNFSVMLVDNDGSLGLSTSTPWKRLSVSGGGVAFSGLSNESGSDNTLCIDPNNFEITNGGATCAASSLRFKENIEDLTYGLEDVLALRPVSYEYIESERPGDDNRYLGFIAEEMLDVIPEVVEFDDEGLPGGIDYAKLTSVLAKAIQELYQSLQNLTGETITYITATFDNLTAKEVTTDKLCVGTVCVTEDEFLAIVQNAGIVQTEEPTPDPEIVPDVVASSTDPEPDPVATTTDPILEPEPVPEPVPDPAPEPELEPEPESIAEPVIEPPLEEPVL